MTNKIIGTIAVLGLLVGATALYFVWPFISPVANSFGSVGVKLAENYDPYIRYNGGYNSALPIQTTGTLQVGTNGPAIPKILEGTCSLIAPSYSVVASTSVAMDCAVTGVVKGDVVFAQFASSTAATGGPGWEVVGASASTTSGFITLSITNGTGGTVIIPASLASSTQYLVY